MTRRAALGFTLLEMMLVIFLIGIAASMVVATMPDNSRYDIRRESQRLAQSLQWMADRAIAGGNDYGLAVSPQHWQLMIQKLDAEPPSGWQQLEQKKVAHQQTLPAGFQLALTLDGMADRFEGGQELPSTPQIMLLPGGEVTPFQLTFLDAESHPQAQIRVDLDGEIRWLDAQALVDADEK